MERPKKLFLSLEDLRKVWDCSLSDIDDYVKQGIVHPVAFIRWAKARTIESIEDKGRHLFGGPEIISGHWRLMSSDATAALPFNGSGNGHQVSFLNPCPIGGQKYRQPVELCEPLCIWRHDLYVPRCEVESAKEKSIVDDLENLPLELQAALKVYDLFWRDLPDDMRQPTFENDIGKFLKESFNFNDTAAKRIDTISKPDDWKPSTGSSDKRPFKRRDQRD